MIDSESKRELFYYSSFEVFSRNDLEPMEDIFGTVPINIFHIEPSNCNYNQPAFTIISEFNVT